MTTYYDLEAFHNCGKLVIQFMPEFLTLIEKNILDSGFSSTPVAEVECLKFIPAAGKYLRLTMQKIEIDYSNEAVDWFLAQDWHNLGQEDAEGPKQPPKISSVDTQALNSGAEELSLKSLPS